MPVRGTIDRVRRLMDALLAGKSLEEAAKLEGYKVGNVLRIARGKMAQRVMREYAEMAAIRRGATLERAMSEVVMMLAAQLKETDESKRLKGAQLLVQLARMKDVREVVKGAAVKGGEVPEEKVDIEESRELLKLMGEAMEKRDREKREAKV